MNFQMGSQRRCEVVAVEIRTVEGHNCVAHALFEKCRNPIEQAPREGPGVERLHVRWSLHGTDRFATLQHEGERR